MKETKVDIKTTVPDAKGAFNGLLSYASYAKSFAPNHLAGIVDVEAKHLVNGLDESADCCLIALEGIGSILKCAEAGGMTGESLQAAGFAIENLAKLALEVRGLKIALGKNCGTNPQSE